MQELRTLKDPNSARSKQEIKDETKLNKDCKKIRRTKLVKIATQHDNHTTEIIPDP